MSLGSQYEYSKPHLRQRGELTLIAEPVVITVNDRSIDDGGVAQLMVAYDIPSTSTNHCSTQDMSLVLASTLMKYLLAKSHQTKLGHGYQM